MYASLAGSLPDNTKLAIDPRTVREQQRQKYVIRSLEAASAAGCAAWN